MNPFLTELLKQKSPVANDITPDEMSQLHDYLGIDPNHPDIAQPPVDINALTPDIMQGAAVPQVPNSPMPDTLPMTPPMGMAESLRQRSGDDMMKPSTAPKGTGTFRKEDNLSTAQTARPKPQVDAPDTELNDATKKRDDMLAWMMMGKGAEKIGTALTHQQSDSKYLDDIKPMAENSVNDVITGRKLKGEKLDQDVKQFNFANAKDKDDPSSEASKFYRETLESITHKKITDKLSAAEMEKIYPVIVKAVEFREGQANRLAMVSMHNSDKKQAQTDKITDDLVKQGTELLDPNKARGGNFAKQQQQVNQADALKQLYTEANGDIRNLDSRQMEELAIGLNKLLSGSGTGASAQITALVPHTVRGNAKKLQEWLTNDPTGTDQMAFVSRMAETVDREHDLAERKVKETKIQRLAGLQKLKDLAPERYNVLTAGAQLTPEDLEGVGKVRTAPTTHNKSSYPKQLINTKTGHQATVSNAAEEKEANQEGFN